MKIPPTHRWDVTLEQAMQIQRDLSARVVVQDLLGEVHTVAGVDVGLEGEDNQIARAAVVVLKFPELTPCDYAIARTPIAFPYIPGLLAFREIPVVLRALEQLKTETDVLILDVTGTLASPPPGHRMSPGCPVRPPCDWVRQVHLVRERKGTREQSWGIIAACGPE